MANRPLRQRLIAFPTVSSRQGLFGDRRVIAEGLKLSPWADVYHTAMTVSWLRFLGALAAMFLVVNVVFAVLMLLGSNPVFNARPGSFADMFFFSVETISTTGYGDMHPQTLYGHSVATAEIFVSLIATAGVTGLIFARFARPRARLIFARHAVIHRHDGVDTLMIRIANARSSFISEATAKLWLLAPRVSAEGRRFTGFVPMRLQKAENPAFVLSWTLFHPIDEASPLFSMTEDQAIADEVNVVLSITGLDETSSQFLHSRYIYAAANLRWGCEFVDMFRRDDEGHTHVDFSKVHETQVDKS